MTRIERVIDDGVAFYERQIARDDDVSLLRGAARFVDEHTLECNGERVEFGQALIASGARPHIPDIPGLERVPFATSDDLLRHASFRAISSASAPARSRSSSPRSTAASAPR
jgi:pyruvate/2-oxoglutarate dehydrogenase complex dihydrolipoamide dehydrogenase (E3) component